MEPTTSLTASEFMAVKEHQLSIARDVLPNPAFAPDPRRSVVPQRRDEEHKATRAVMCRKRHQRCEAIEQHEYRCCELV
jgi:hypothetical protein